MLAAFVVPLAVLLFWHFHTMVHLKHSDAIKLEFQLSGKTSILDVEYMDTSPRNNSKD